MKLIHDVVPNEKNHADLSHICELVFIVHRGSLIQVRNDFDQWPYLIHQSYHLYFMLFIYKILSHIQCLK